ncbi:MAG: hypothetical protein IJ711_09105, partial [Lachnospiraceae bacterium]|nr:hypothetical protein [Lachnospiraceae bacterium]
MKQIIHKKTVWVGVTVLILCAALLIAFIGFRRKESKSRLLADGEIASAQEITSEKLENSKWLCTLGDHMVVYSSALGQYKARRFSCVSKNGEITDAPYTLDKFERVSELCADPEGNLLLTSSLAGDNYVKLYDSEGSCLFQVNLTEKIGNGRVDSVRRDASGFLYIIARDENEALLYVLDSQGNIQSKFPLLFTVGYLRNLGNGDVACVYMEEDAQNGGVQFAVQVYADAQKAEKYILPVRSLPDLTAVQDGGAFDLYYYDSNYRLYGYDLKKKQSTEIVNLFEAGIPGSEI